jgi:hypothetical protein
MDIYGYFFGYMRAPKIDKLNKEIVSLIGELDEFKGRWATTQALAPDRLAALRQVATIEPSVRGSRQLLRRDRAVSSERTHEL